MLCLSFQIGKEQYALRATEIVEVLPVVTLRPVPGAPGYLAGMLDYRGRLLPVVDLNRLGGGTACRASASTRILLTELPDGETTPLLGLMVERATDTIELDPGTLQDFDPRLLSAPYLGRIGTTGGRVVQLVELSGLLPEELRPLPEDAA